VRNVNIPAVHYGKAVQLARAGHLDQGADELQKAVTAQPKLLLGQAMLGEWRLAQNNPSAAIPALEQAKELAPEAYDIRNNLALAYLGSGRLADAEREITAAIPAEKEDAWRGSFILGTASQLSGDYSDAADSFRAALRLKPDFHEAQAALAALPSASKSQPPSAQPDSIALPYSTLMIKSEDWPYYP
jgi:predicted Zn-dependent protease